MLSQKCKYAIRAVIYIAAESSVEKGLKGGREIAEALKIPFAFTGKILQELAKQNIVSSTKGPKGGFYLSEKNTNALLIEIIEVMGDISYFTTCGLGLAVCSEDHPCPIHDAFKVSRDNLLTLFKSKTIGELGKEVKSADVFLVK